jgi:hypothetical protein
MRDEFAIWSHGLQVNDRNLGPGDTRPSSVAAMAMVSLPSSGEDFGASHVGRMAQRDLDKTLLGSFNAHVKQLGRGPI